MRGLFLRTPWQIVLVALLIRMLLIIPEHRYIVNPSKDHFRFGWEMGRVAQSLAAGKGFSSPYGGETGPTATLPPVYPCLLAGVFRLFGIYTVASAYVILILNSIFSALTCWAVYFIARETIGETVALLSAWIWAFIHPALLFSTRVVWETTLTTFLLSLAVLLALRLKQVKSFWHWLVFGMICGLGTLSNSAVVSVVPLLFVWLWWRNRTNEILWLVGVGIMGFLLTLTPWVVRNYVVFHKVIPFRTNFGLEFQIGNNLQATGHQVFDLHPSHSAREFDDYRSMGETEYMGRKKREAQQFIQAHPGDFMFLTLKRTALWWVEGWEISGDTPLTSAGAVAELLGYSLFSGITFLGLALALRSGQADALLFGGLLVFYPLVYYVTVVNSRMRHPLEPFMLILTVYALQQTLFKKKSPEPSPPTEFRRKVLAEIVR